MISTPIFAIGIPGLEGIGAPELIIILVIVLVLFGPKRLPQLGKSLGKTMKSIRDGMEGKTGDDEKAVSDKTASETDDAEKDAAKKDASAKDESGSPKDESDSE